jgi:hypothetical protein
MKRKQARLPCLSRTSILRDLWLSFRQMDLAGFRVTGTRYTALLLLPNVLGAMDIYISLRMPLSYWQRKAEE